MMHYTLWTVFSAFSLRCTPHLMPFAATSRGLYFFATKMMSPMYAMFSKQKALTGNMPNTQNHMFSIAEFRDSFQLQKSLFSNYSYYLIATRISSAQINRIKGRHSSQRMPMICLHDFSTLHDLVSCQIQLASHCTIEWALIRMA